METIKEEVEALAAAIQESPEYRNFQKAKQRVRSVPGMEEKIKEFCWKNYELQNSCGEDFSRRLEEFEQQYRDFRRNPAVEKYLESELAMCRMIQAVSARIMDAVELLI